MGLLLKQGTKSLDKVNEHKNFQDDQETGVGSYCPCECLVQWFFLLRNFNSELLKQYTLSVLERKEKKCKALYMKIDIKNV